MGPNTKLYCSFSAAPGRFGATVFNQLFKKYQIDAVYLPRLAPPARDLVPALKALRVSGCAISQPIKKQIIPFLDESDSLVMETRSCNTLILREGKVCGYNTDRQGAEEALQECDLNRVLIYGAGGVLGSLVAALKKLEAKSIFISARRQEAALAAAQEFGIKAYYDTGERFSLLINATPTPANGLTPELSNFLKSADSLFDLVIAPEPTPLGLLAKKNKKLFIPGWKMAIGQAREQFFLYEGIQVEADEIEKILFTQYLKG